MDKKNPKRQSAPGYSRSISNFEHLHSLDCRDWWLSWKTLKARKLWRQALVSTARTLSIPRCVSCWKRKTIADRGRFCEENMSTENPKRGHQALKNGARPLGPRILLPILGNRHADPLPCRGSQLRKTGYNKDPFERIASPKVLGIRPKSSHWQ
jgi:hypothetical protein